MILKMKHSARRAESILQARTENYLQNKRISCEKAKFTLNIACVQNHETPISSLNATEQTNLPPASLPSYSL
jgi:hypothetical protein